jgi:light-regulated signal transduction histidine kinase (bacteriophytochrome)
VSHDLRAPLRHIAGYIGMLREEPESTLSAQAQRYAGIVADSADRMSRLIDDLLEFSRMGRREMLKDRVEMATLVAEVMRELRLAIEGRSVSWQIGDLPEVNGDRVMLKQVWVNLLSNAVKYTGKKEHAVIQVSAARSEGEWRFSVVDNGAGFDPEHAGRLFGVFQRLHAVRDFDGTGIGLANVRRIVVRHGGRTWAAGRVGEGATFGFSLPVVQ